MDFFRPQKDEGNNVTSLKRRKGSGGDGMARSMADQKNSVNDSEL
jgi:hypothetical protein